MNPIRNITSKRAGLILVSLISLLPSKGHAQPEITDKKVIAWEGYKVEWANFSDEHGKKIPYILILPRVAKNVKVPCVFGLHGITGSKWEWTDVGGFTKGGNLTEKLLGKGYAVFAIDFPKHGDRAGKAYTSFNDHFNDITKDTQGWVDFYDEAAADVLSGIGYLKSRAEIDGSRLGLIGYSFGSILALETGTHPPGGIRTIIACVPPSLEEFRHDDPRDKLGGEYPEQGFATKIVPLIKAPSLLMITGVQDPWSSEEQANLVFSMIPVEDKRHVVYDSGHSLPHAYTNVVIEWILQRI